MSEMRNTAVEHITWGPGKVVSRAGGVVTVRFAGKGVKEFVYPDAFDKYLAALDAEQNSAIMADLALKKEALAAECVARLRLREKEKTRALQEAEDAAEEKRKAKNAAKRKPVKI